MLRQITSIGLVMSERTWRVDADRAAGVLERLLAVAVHGRSARGHDHATRVRGHPIPGLLAAGVHLVRPADRERLGLAFQRRGHARDDFTS